VRGGQRGTTGRANNRNSKYLFFLSSASAGDCHNSGSDKITNKRYALYVDIIQGGAK